jgi:hypothetical protein
VITSFKTSWNTTISIDPIIRHWKIHAFVDILIVHQQRVNFILMMNDILMISWKNLNKVESDVSDSLTWMQQSVWMGIWFFLRHRNDCGICVGMQHRKNSSCLWTTTLSNWRIKNILMEQTWKLNWSIWKKRYNFRLERYHQIEAKETYWLMEVHSSILIRQIDEMNE